MSDSEDYAESSYEESSYDDTDGSASSDAQTNSNKAEKAEKTSPVPSHLELEKTHPQQVPSDDSTVVEPVSGNAVVLDIENNENKLELEHRNIVGDHTHSKSMFKLHAELDIDRRRSEIGNEDLHLATYRTSDDTQWFAFNELTMLDKKLVDEENYDELMQSKLEFLVHGIKGNAKRASTMFGTSPLSQDEKKMNYDGLGSIRGSIARERTMFGSSTADADLFWRQNGTGLWSNLTQFMRSSTDPYCQVIFLPNKNIECTSWVSGGGENVLYTEKDNNFFTFDVANKKLGKYGVILEIWDYEIGTHDRFVGATKYISIDPCLEHPDRTLYLHANLKESNQYRGRIVVACKYVTNQNKKPEHAPKGYKVVDGYFTVRVLRARDLWDVSQSNQLSGKLIVSQVVGIISFVVLMMGLFVWIENWTWVDTLYFTMVTIATVGYGDFSPSTQVARLLAAILILISTLFIFVFISMLFDYYTAVRITKAVERNKSKERRKKFVDDASTMRQSMLIREQLKLDELSSNSRKIPEWIVHGIIFLFWTFGWALFFTFSDSVDSKTGQIYQNTFIDGIYFAVVTASTVGYGDIGATTVSQKLFASIFIFWGVTTLAKLGASLSDALKSQQAELEKDAIINAATANEHAILAFDDDGIGEVDKFEFLKKMLIQMKLVSKEEIQKIMQRFQELDVDGSGTLDKSDFQRLSAIMGRQGSADSLPIIVE